MNPTCLNEHIDHARRPNGILEVIHDLALVRRGYPFDLYTLSATSTRSAGPCILAPVGHTQGARGVQGDVVWTRTLMGYKLADVRTGGEVHMHG